MCYVKLEEDERRMVHVINPLAPFAFTDGVKTKLLVVFFPILSVPFDTLLCPSMIGL